MELFINGIYTEKAIADMGGNIEAYKKLLGNYRRDIPGKTAAIREKQQLPDLSEFVILVHGQKGASRILGITELGDEFYDLELAGKAGNREFIEENLDKVLAHYNYYYEALAPYDIREKQVAVEGSFEELLNNLNAALEDFETDEAEKLVSQAEVFCVSDELKEVFGRLQDAMDNMDYFASIDCVKELLEVTTGDK